MTVTPKFSKVPESFSIGEMPYDTACILVYVLGRIGGFQVGPRGNLEVLRNELLKVGVPPNGAGLVEIEPHNTNANYIYLRQVS